MWGLDGGKDERYMAGEDGVRERWAEAEEWLVLDITSTHIILQRTRDPSGVVSWNKGPGVNGGGNEDGGRSRCCTLRGAEEWEVLSSCELDLAAHARAQREVLPRDKAPGAKEGGVGAV